MHQVVRVRGLDEEQQHSPQWISLTPHYSFGASTLFRMGVTMRKVLGSVVYMAVSTVRVL